jgi:predicted 3-demethylubiquinone-9 3-methyltransferase (glyoxalase superfamily)
MRNIFPFLWFNGNAEDAVNFYLSVFENSKVTQITHYARASEEVSGKPRGAVMTIAFELNGSRFVALNGGDEIKMNWGTSFVVPCNTQQEIDDLWGKLSDGGQIIECGWLTDKFGVTWQIVPAVLDELLSDEDEAKRERVMAALLKMKKLDIEKLKAA